MALFIKHSARAAAGLTRRSTARTLPTQAVYWRGGRVQVGTVTIRVTAPEATAEAKQIVSALKTHTGTMSATPVFVDGGAETDLFVFVCREPTRPPPWADVVCGGAGLCADQTGRRVTATGEKCPFCSSTLRHRGVLSCFPTPPDDAALTTDSAAELGYWAAKQEMTDGSEGLVVLMGSSALPTMLAGLPSVSGSTAAVTAGIQ